MKRIVGMKFFFPERDGVQQLLTEKAKVFKFHAGVSFKVLVEKYFTLII